MASSLNWGILATGGIAHQFAAGLKVSKTGKLVAVGSRALDTAKAFTDKHGGKPYDTYEQVLNDPHVEAVYIATPHHMHYEWTIKCAEAGKAILCEKPFTLNAVEAQRALNEVRKNKVFFMEAFMYRCTNLTAKAKELVKSGAIGELLAINAEFSFAAGKEWANFRTEGALGGGGLMDVGVYPISFCRLLAGSEPDVAHYAAKMAEKGYDEYGSGCLRFSNGVTAHFGCGIHCNMRNNVYVYGSSGMLEIDYPWKVAKGSRITLTASGADPQVFDFGMSNDELYGVEADAVAEYIDAKECPYMTLEDTMGNMRTIDMLRASAGMRFAAESLA